MHTKYQELHNQFREAVNIYFKGSSMAAAVIAFALGYLFKVPLEHFLSRTISTVVLVIIGFYYVCTVWGIRVYSSLTMSINF